MFSKGRPDRRPKERNRERKPPRPLDAARLNELALAYVARFATSAAKLERYLARKLAERGWEGDDTPPLAEIVARFVAAGYVDDEAFARAKAGSMLRRGLGERRIDAALGADGITADLREAAHASHADQRRAALAFARKRRFGPFGPLGPGNGGLPDRALREKQLAALLRAGHRLDSARELVNAASVEAAEEWAAALDDDEPGAD